MKKILIALAMLAAAIVIPASVAPSAQADTCGEWYNIYGDDNIIDDGRTRYQHWGVLEVRECTGGQQYYEARQYEVHWSKLNTPTSCGNGHLIYWEVDPNVLGNWNPQVQWRYCDGSYSYNTSHWAGANPEKIYAGMSSAERCIGATTLMHYDDEADQTYNIPNICLSFPF